MEIRKLHRDSMATEYGVGVQRLLPWEVLNAPFEGAACAIEPGGATDPHEHHEYEMFIAISGEGALEAEGEHSAFMPGDVVHFKPGVRHQVINAGQGDFLFYSIWWDPPMSENFTTRHNAAAADTSATPHPAAGPTP